MAKFVPDVKTQRWIIISPVRSARPSDHHKSQAHKKTPRVCPFCYGNEGFTPPEVYRVGKGEREEPGWLVRVVPNKFPITDIHEVIINSPDHEKGIAELALSQVELLLIVYRSRFQTHLGDGQVMIFGNQGAHAGASLEHPHSQIVVIPRQINLDALIKEPVRNLIEENDYFSTYCPDFSQWPYEVWIAPKKEETLFSDITDQEISSLAVVFQKTLRCLKVIYERQEAEKGPQATAFAFNFYIHHAKNWFIRIIPRLVHRAGFELGTGLSVNIIDPVDAARELQEIEL